MPRQVQKARRQVSSETEFQRMLDILLVLDKSVLEHSMAIYKIPDHARHAMRDQNRRLHRAVREYLPRLAGSPQDHI